MGPRCIASKVHYQDEDPYTLTSVVALHEWQGRPFNIRLVSGDYGRSLEITPPEEGGLSTYELNDSQQQRLRSAANIALELDAANPRALWQGECVRIHVKRPQPKPPARPRRVEEVITQRPQIEELIAPLLFDSPAKTPLRPFQEFGVRWLSEHRAGILADDMGLGKTAQALRAVGGLIEQGTIRSALVVCPKSLIANWEAECERWIPGLTVVRCVPSKNESGEVWAAILGRSHIIITSYEQLRPLPKPLDLQRIELVIADEAHKLRRSEAKLVRAFRQMNAERTWALTGTPMERDEVDLATLLSLLDPTRFSARSVAIDSAVLRAQARPYLLRRLKRDVLGELPDVIETKELVELIPRQQRAYTAARSQPLPKSDGEVLQRLTLLRSICDVDPESGASAKLDRVVEILQDVQQAGEKAVVFSYLLQPLDVLVVRLAQKHPLLRVVTLTGELTTDERGRVLRDFKTDKEVVALVCSSRVGGEGLTLTEANHVIFINEWWNPSANAQARDRVVRLGQERIVHVHRFRCQGTIEESLDLILNRKNAAFANIVDALASGAHLSDGESRELLEEVLGELAPVRN